MTGLILSVFSGIDLLGHGFTNKGFCVVSGAEKFLGKDIRGFIPPSGAFDGVIGGSPCQDFSRKNRNPSDNSHKMLIEFIRVVEQAEPKWFLHENVIGVPEFKIDGYEIQRFELDLAWFSDNSRRRVFTFGSRCGTTINPMIKTNGKVKNTAVTCSSDLSIVEMARIQGCNFVDDLEHFTVKGKKTVIGNAVPLVMAEYLADLINKSFYVTHRANENVTCPGNKTVTHQVTESDTPVLKKRDTSIIKKCDCGCGRHVTGRKKYAHQNCRKKASRARSKANLF